MDDHPAPASDPAVAELRAATQALFESRRFAAQLAIERQHLRDSLDRLRAEEREAARRDLIPQVEAALRERDGALAARDAAWRERDQARAAAQAATAALERVTSSTAWRITGPVRRVLQTLLRR